MSDQEDNRWARPVMDDVSWDHATGIPAFLNERGIREGLAKHVGLPAMIIVAGDPMLHRVDEGDGNPVFQYWRSAVYLISSTPTGIEGTRFSSLCVRDPEDTIESVRDDLLNKCVNFITKCEPSTKIKYVS
jgi:hypothetical protein